jgi:hypothetical protein
MSGYELRLASWSDSGLPWEREALGLLEEIATERLPEHLTAHVRDKREERAREQQEREREQAALRADAELLGRLPELTVAKRATAIPDVGERYGRRGPSAEAVADGNDHALLHSVIDMASRGWLIAMEEG